MIYREMILSLLPILVLYGYEVHFSQSINIEQLIFASLKQQTPPSFEKRGH